jgi:glycosyltransferase involved in cell wall biosynthesis
MAIKLILTQIMKNEAHVAERMLNSIKSIVDGIVVIDTGSTDDSINVVRSWGEANGIETYVFERPFDNFENSRNYSFQKAREIFLNKNDGNIYYNFWLDFDEQIVVDQKFNKQAIDKDLYMFSTYIGKMFYTINSHANDRSCKYFHSLITLSHSQLHSKRDLFRHSLWPC